MPADRRHHHLLAAHLQAWRWLPGLSSAHTVRRVGGWMAPGSTITSCTSWRSQPGQVTEMAMQSRCSIRFHVPVPGQDLAHCSRRPVLSPTGWPRSDERLRRLSVDLVVQHKGAPAIPPRDPRSPNRSGARQAQDRCPAVAGDPARAPDAAMGQAAQPARASRRTLWGGPPPRAPSRPVPTRPPSRRRRWRSDAARSGQTAAPARCRGTQANPSPIHYQATNGQSSQSEEPLRSKG